MKVHASLLCHGTNFAFKYSAIHFMNDQSGHDQSLSCLCSNGW